MTDTNESAPQTMLEKHNALQAAYEPWITKEYPDAKCIGDVVLAMAMHEDLPASEGK